MAERGTYRATRGNSLLNVPQVQASDAPAQLLGAVGEAAGQFGVQIARRSADAAESARIKLIGNSLEQTRVSLAEYVAKRPDDPTVDNAMQEHINGTYRQLAKTDPNGAEQYRLSADVLRRTYMISVNKNWNQSVGEQQKGTYETARRNALALLASTDPVDAAVFVQNFNDAHAMIYSKKPDGSFNYTQAEQTSKENSLLSDVMEEVVRNNIANANPEKLAVMLDGLTKRQMKIQPLEMVGMESDMYKVVGAQKMDMYAAMVRQRMSQLASQEQGASVEELTRAKDTYAFGKAAAKDGNMSPGGFAKMREAAAVMSQTPEELSTHISEINVMEKEMYDFQSGYASPLTNAAGLSGKAREGYDKSIKDANENNAAYVRKITSLNSFPGGSRANDAYDNMIESIGTGDLQTAAQSYQDYRKIAVGMLGVKGVGFDTPLLESDAQTIASRINNMHVPEGVSPSRHRAAALRGLQSVFGNDSDKVMRQIFPNGNDKNIFAASQMDYEGASTDLMNALDARSVVNEQLGEATISRIRQSVASNETVSNFVASFPNNGTDVNMALAWQDNVAALAAWYARTMPEGQAVQAAVDGIIGANYVMAGSLRIPKANARDLDMTQLMKAGTPLFGQAVYAKIKDSISFPPEKAPESLIYSDPNLALEEYKKIAARAPHLVTNSDGKGALLVDTLGAPIYANGAPVQFTLDELASMVKPTLDAAGADELRRNTLWPGVVKTEDIVNGPPAFPVDPKSPLGKVLWGGNNNVIGTPRKR